MPSSKFPDVVLDTTLAELLSEEPGWEGPETLCNIKPTADPTSTSVPLNKKFLITSSKAADTNDLAHFQLETVNKLLSFWAGHMEVAFVASEGLTDDESLTRDAIGQQAREDYSVLNEKQRPWPKVFANSDDFVQHYKGDNANARVRWAFAVDFAEQIPSFIEPELQYHLNSKRFLAECPLKSANDEIIDPECSCPTHATKQGLWFFGGSDCDTCKTTVDKERNRLREKLQNKESPFVLKLAQSLGAVGTWLVRDEDQRAKTIEDITRIQGIALPLVTSSNAHIRPTSLVLSDFIPGDTKAVNFFVRRDGSVKFLGACQQLGTRKDGGIQHSALIWSQQDKFEQMFKPTLAEIGEVLKGAGYFGPCGADIMEANGTQYVIDLNVRSTLSIVLGVLKGHCKKRGFDICGAYECMLLRLSKDELEKEFREEFEQGRIILLGTTRLGTKDKWAYPLIIAGEDADTIQDLGKRLRSLEATGADDARDAGGA